MSAMRPAKTDTIAGTFGARHSATRSTCSAVMTAVTLTITRGVGERAHHGPVNAPLVVVTGIFTLTLSPHEAIARPCAIISSKSSAKTSNEIGRSGIAADQLAGQTLRSR